MKIDSWQCDICQTQKKDANHWFRGYKLIEGGVVIVPWDSGSPTDPVENGEAHLCGAECSSKWLSQELFRVG